MLCLSFGLHLLKFIETYFVLCSIRHKSIHNYVKLSFLDFKFKLCF